MIGTYLLSVTAEPSNHFRMHNDMISTTTTTTIQD